MNDASAIVSQKKHKTTFFEQWKTVLLSGQSINANMYGQKGTVNFRSCSFEARTRAEFNVIRKVGLQVREPEIGKSLLSLE